jgi:g-D-glutamyl-meso-diaminopimelate peptidase
MTGTDVLWVQNVLHGEGLVVSRDGVYGRQTRDRVKTMQGWNGLTQDGVVGPKTWEVLKKY